MQMVGLYKEAFKHVLQLRLTQLKQELARKAIQSTIPSRNTRNLYEVSC